MDGSVPNVQRQLGKQLQGETNYQATASIENPHVVQSIPQSEAECQDYNRTKTQQMNGGDTQSFQTNQNTYYQQDQNNEQNPVPQCTPLGEWSYYHKSYEMYEYCRKYFNGQLQIIYDLHEVVDSKWNQGEKNAYFLFLRDVEEYIKNTIFKPRQRTVWYLEQYERILSDYCTYTNPAGHQLYLRQLDYAIKKQSGYDFKMDKKNKIKIAPVVPTTKKREVTQKKEEVLIRSSDPTINFQELMATQWPLDTEYINPKTLLKPTANLVFIGHVDSGKSTLTGNILKQLNEVDEQEWLKNKQDALQNKMESWTLAGISDVDPNERKDGKTRECAKLIFTLPDRRFTLIDAPGHKNYVPNMIMGACQADIALLIISAKQGEFESGFEKEGQTKEHAMLAKALGVVQLTVVVTKMGTVNWEQKRFTLIKEQVAPFLANSCGFSNVDFIPVESLANENIHSRLAKSWYDGPCLIEYLNKISLPARTPMGPLRIPIIDKFKDVGQLYIYGKIESGTIIQDHTVSLLPSRKNLIIKEIFNVKDERMPFATAGENVKIKIKAIEESEIRRGDVICNNLNYCQQSCQFKAKITILQLPQQKKILSSGYQGIIHLHAIAQQMEIAKVQTKFDNVGNKFVPASFLKAGESGTVIIKLQRPICLEKYQFMPSLGRFTLRDQGKTIGYGEVSKIKPAKVLLKEQKDQLMIDKKLESLDNPQGQEQQAQNVECTQSSQN